MWQLTIKGCHVLARGAVNKHSELEEHYAITDCLGEVIQAPCYLINQSINQKEKKNRKMGEGGEGGGKLPASGLLKPPWVGTLERWCGWADNVSPGDVPPSQDVPSCWPDG